MDITKTSSIFALVAALSACTTLAPADVPATSNEQVTSDTDLLLHVPSPDWRDQIIYFIMTDRFQDGDPGNNDQGVGVYDPSKEHYYSGGDIQGIIDELDYIEGLGATTVWATPVIYNQWKNPRFDFTGYSGYYGLNFAEIDPHNGTLETYQQLSDQLHRRGMYLIKDIVVNHTGFLFEYQGEYNPNNTLENFSLVEPNGLAQAANVLEPFDKFDRTNPDHADAGVYNWTPTITDYQNLGPRQFTHQLGGLADINTSNPIVIDVLKEVYGAWIAKAGIDGLRIDTVRYVEPDFFARFMNDTDGILAQAQATGREAFISFGEVLDYSAPLENSGELALAKYLGSDDSPILSSIISFPLKQELKTVFAQGKPTAHLAYRLDQHMQIFRTPFLSPTLIDNHDVERFLASGSMPGFKQALATMFTIPGIPTIYQGTAQAFQETRQAMFAGGYLSNEDRFDETSELYRFISNLAELRKANPVFSRGSMEQIQSSDYGPGLLAYRRSYEGETVDVLFNTSDERLLVDNYAFADAGNGPLDVMFTERVTGPFFTREGKLTSVLPARSILVAKQSEVSPAVEPEAQKSPPSLIVREPASIYTSDIVLDGQIHSGGSQVWLIKNGRIKHPIKIDVAPDGTWSHTHRVENLGEERLYLLAYDPATQTASERISLVTHVEAPALSYGALDPNGDDTGPEGNYVDMQHASANGQKDLLAVEAIAGGDTLQLQLTMEDVTTDWLPPNGFDNVAFNIFFDLPGSAGVSFLPELNANMPIGLNWDLAHISYGWGNTTFSNEGATPDLAGRRFGATPNIMVDKEANSITFTYKGRDYGIADWAGVKIYIATWDIAGEGAYVLLGPEPAEWAFGGGDPSEPKILDDHFIDALD